MSDAQFYEKDQYVQSLKQQRDIWRRKFEFNYEHELDKLVKKINQDIVKAGKPIEYERLKDLLKNKSEMDKFFHLWVKLSDIQKVVGEKIDGLALWLNSWADYEKHDKVSKDNKVSDFGEGYRRAVTDIMEKIDGHSIVNRVYGNKLKPSPLTGKSNVR